MVASVSTVIAQEFAFKTFNVQGTVVTGKVPANSPYLDGHFPGMPVFPAVGIVDASLHFVRESLGNRNLRLSGLPSAKFLSPIGPERQLRIELKSLNEQNWQVEWMDEDSQKTLSLLRLQIT